MKMRVSLPLLLMMSAMLLALSSPAPGLAAPHDRLLERYHRWRGTAAQDISLEAQGIVAAAGLNGTQRRFVRGDGFWRDEADLGPVRQVSAVTPDRAWRTNASGQVEPLSTSEAAERRAFADLYLGRNPSGLSLSLRPSERRDGRLWSVIRYSVDAVDGYDLFIEPRTGALHGIRATEDGRTRFIRFADWRRVGGLRLPFQEQVIASNQAENVTVRFERINLVPQLSAEVFAAPRLPTRVVLHGGGTSTRPMPFNFFRESRVFLPATVNGMHTEVLLDSGAQASVIDREFARRLGIEPEGQLNARGTGGEARAQFARGVTIRVGDLELRDLTVVVLDLSQVGRGIGRQLPVILGAEVFNELAVDIDFPGRMIRFHRSGTFQPPVSATRIPLRSEGGLRVVELSVEGRAPVPVTFDLGAGGALSLHHHYWTSSHLLEGRRASRTLAGAVGGLREVPLATLRTVELAGVTFRNVPATFADAAGAFDERRTSGNLGMPIISRFNVVTDYARDALYLVPTPGMAEAPFRRNRSGLLATHAGDRLKVLYVAPGSPAAAGPWRAEEEIVAINGRRVGADFHSSPISSWAEAAAGTRVTLTLASGERRELVLADYY
jgi:hypothetical protein